MSPPMALVYLTIFLMAFIPPLTATKEETPSTAYNLLEDYGFPVGLLPKGVTGYTLNNKTGQFSVSFDGICSFSIEGSYPLKYKQTIKGYISKEKLSKLEGVSVKVLLFWVNIVEIVRSEDELEFSVGIASANYGIENFYESPQCGCGFNCDDDRKVESVGFKFGRSTPFVSSS